MTSSRPAQASDTPGSTPSPYRLRARRAGIDTRQEAVIFLPRGSPVVRSEGLEALSRLDVAWDGQAILATLNVVEPGSGLVDDGEAALSESAWARLGVREGDVLTLAHPAPIGSLTHLRAKMNGGRLGPRAMQEIVQDVVAARYSELQLSAFVAACAGGGLDFDEIVSLTRAMVREGRRLDWHRERVVDKHCIGGLLGNRTSPIVVAIAAANGLVIPKTSSRAITSPAGTADVMETLAPVNLSIDDIRRVVDQEGGCLVWGGTVQLSPADDILIRVERALDIDSSGQLIASVLSKKVAAGSTHVVVDLPWGPRAKIRSLDEAERLGRLFQGVGRMVGLEVRPVVTDGSQPVGRGFGPALEAHDVLAVLQGTPDAPDDLRERALTLAGLVLEWSPGVHEGEGLALARATLEDGRAWARFQAICEAQGGLHAPPRAPLTHPVLAARAGRVVELDNRRLGRIAKFAGAPTTPAAGLVLHVRRGQSVEAGQPLLTIHATSRAVLDYALGYAASQPDVVAIRPDGP